MSGLRWAGDADRRDAVLAPVADVLFSAAHLVAGERVLDIGCGCGATTLAAARAVAPDGNVTGIDLSAPMLDVARRRLGTAGVDNCAFVQGDVQAHPFRARGRRRDQPLRDRNRLPRSSTSRAGSGRAVASASPRGSPTSATNGSASPATS